jgi:hypothetical protein
MFKKSFKTFKRYIGIFYFLSIFLSLTHHHNDLKLHNDCKICILQSDILNSNTPPQTIFLSNIGNFQEEIVADVDIALIQKIKTSLHQRAPPYNYRSN